MDKYANTIRTEQGLFSGLASIRELSQSFSAGHAIETGENISDAVAARHALKMSELVLTCMSQRKESRGAHYREDNPNKDDKNFSFRITIGSSNGKAQLGRI